MKIAKHLLILPLAALCFNAYAVTANTTAVFTEISAGKVGQKIPLKSHHTYTITNDTLQTIVFDVRMRLCPADWPDKCVDTGLCQGTVAPGQVLHREFDYATTVQYYSTGQKYVFAETTISGAAKSDATDSKYIMVS